MIPIRRASSLLTTATTRFFPAALLRASVRCSHRWTGTDSTDADAAAEQRPKWVVPSLVAASVGVVAANTYFYVNGEVVEKVKALEYAEFNHFKLVDVIPVSHDTSLFRFRAAHQIPDQEKMRNVKSKAQVNITTNEYVPSPNHIVVKDDTCQVGRSYTPITYGRDHFDLLVKRYENGSVSKMIHDLKVGEEGILARGPILSFPYTENMAERIVMIAGGTGITPMYQLMKQILRSPTDRSQINLIYGSRTEADILLGHELQILSNKFPDRLKVHHVIQSPASKTNATDANGFEVKHRGFITEQVLKECGIATPQEEPLVLVCGPDPMVEVLAGEKPTERNQGPLRGILAKMGYTPQQVFKF